MKKILLFAAFIYFLIAPLTYHPDNKLVLKWAGENHGAVWNIWEYGQKNYQDEDNFNYPPLHFYLDKLQYFLAIPIAGEGFHEWLSTPNASDPYEPHLIRYSLAMKTGLILFSLLAGYLLYRIAKQTAATEKQAQAIAALWLFNPIVLYSIPIMGQNDVMAIVFFLVGWYFLAYSRIKAVIAFGLGASIKMFPLIWLPFLLITTSRFTAKEKWLIFSSSVGVYFVTLLPFITNPVFQRAVLSSDINTRFFIAQIGLGFSENIQLVPILLLVLGFVLYTKQKEQKSNIGIGYQAFSIMTCNLLLLGFSHFHPQWFTWLIPFWALWYMSLKREDLPLAGLMSFLTFGAWCMVVILFQDASLSYGLLVPINATVTNLPILRDFLITKNIKALDYNNYAHTWLAAMATLALTGIFVYFKKVKETTFVEFKLTQLPVSKFVKFISILIASLSFSFIVIFSSFVIFPAPLSSPAPVIVEYEPVLKPVETTFTAQFNSLSRIDLYFQNPDLKNKDEYVITIKDNNRQSILQQTISGFNVGFPSVLRLDVPLQSNSKNRQYTVELNPVTRSASTIEIALTQEDSTDAIAIKSYYTAPRGLSYNFSQAVKQTQRLLQEVPLLYLGLAVILFFAL